MPPNILFAFADDWGRYASAYRPFEGENSINSLINTPNFDRIAGEGALFLNGFVPAPTCTPCRSSILSGQYFWQTAPVLARDPRNPDDLDSRGPDHGCDSLRYGILEGPGGVVLLEAL